MRKLKNLFERNRQWAEGVKSREPDFFEKLSRQQSPEYLWIGCADSRVPANEITGLLPGEMFVHRNVANMVVHTDFNCLSVIQYAVEVLGVKHIIVCGHYGCGGVRAAMEHKRHGLIDNWLRHIQDVNEKHAPGLARLADDTSKFDRLCELNVIEQVKNICQTTIVENAWAREQDLTVHGWIYRLDDGLLHDLNITVINQDELRSFYGEAIANPVTN